ncbi:hypothetical protein [Flavobacterium sp. LM4]|uniref:hypothetical protein n=1 Tax=Flavobacterium sp. LM4 TaxID=1938609 RepID=UPI000F4E47FE|nr:hypothetical protein [Flavobacterium sp. LM4]
MSTTAKKRCSGICRNGYEVGRLRSAGLMLDQVIPHYEAAGYTVNQYVGPMNNESVMPWIANEMGNGRIVQFNLGY